MVPRPYVIHAPIDGRPMKFAPVFSIVSVGSWFGMSAYIDLITHMSSATVPRLGHSSLISSPLLPHFWNLNGDFIRLPVLRCVRIGPPGSGCPSYLSSIGLWSNVSTCDTPPFIIRKMTRLALGLKCRLGRTPPLPPVGIVGAVAAACASDVFSICDSA